MALPSLPPGFRFHPTDVELTVYYLKRKLLGKKLRCNAVTDVDLYKFAPWDLPDKASLRSGDLEWYFFCTRDRKYSVGSRTKRSTEAGYWKATGKDRPVMHKSRTVGMKRTLVFHLGKPPRGSRTDWVMYEYRLVESDIPASHVDDCVLCKIFKKSGLGPKTGEQYGAPFDEEEWNDVDGDGDGDGDVSCFPPAPSSFPPSVPHAVLNSGQELAVSQSGKVSLSLLSENNGELAANCVGPVRTRSPDISRDNIHIQQLAEIIGGSSTNCLGQDGPPPDSTAGDDSEALFDGSETIFDVPEEVAPLWLDSVCVNQCNSCGARLVEPLLEPVEGEQFLELNDLLFYHADDHHPDHHGLLLSNGVSDEQPLHPEPKGEREPSPDGVCNSTTSAAAGTVAL
uniref:Uncharacterized protein n=1 Tax=Avena sativa TaxID=4498 RepID=A0ACD5WQP4_AVESA